MNTAIKGDKGVLEFITNEFNGYDKQIGGLSAGIALGGLAAIGGVLVIIAGAVGTPFTAGGSVPIIAGGVALLALGAGVRLYNATLRCQELDGRATGMPSYWEGLVSTPGGRGYLELTGYAGSLGFEMRTGAAPPRRPRDLP